MPVYKLIPESVLNRPHDFWSRVDVDMVNVDACFPWKGRYDRQGYGRTGRHLYAHRVAYALTNGQIADGLTIDHICGNRYCCNRAHLEAVTISENLARRGACPLGAVAQAPASGGNAHRKIPLRPLPRDSQRKGSREEALMQFATSQAPTSTREEKSSNSRASTGSDGRQE